VVNAAPTVERWWRSDVTRFVAGGNLVGALVTFSYFSFLDRDDVPTGTAANAAFFVVAFVVVAGLGTLLAARWRPATLAGRDGIADAETRRRALVMPFVLAGISAMGWVLSGLAWGLLWPALTGELTLARALRLNIGITLVGGTITTAFIFFAVERAWRRRLPVLFPRGDLSAVAGVPRLRVRRRLVAVFLLVGLLPMLIVGRFAYRSAGAIAGADPGAASDLLRHMAVVIAFLIGIGALTAVGLALFVSRSVAEPLRDVEAAMARVGAGDLDTRCPVVSNDEIGAVAEGFNRMVAGLRERERIRETFGKYVSPEVRDEILAGRASLDGQVREVTILFSDLRDFTPWVESHPPDEVVRDLNAYFTLMEGAIRAHGGLVVQFIGDEIEAVFGAPVPEPRHADRALAAAFDMRQRLAEWNGARHAQGSVELKHGIGVHTGEVLAASIGSPDRLSYALVGDPVNLASRLQSLTKEVGGDLLVSGDTVRRLCEPVALEALPAVRVKGRTAEVEVYRAG
jgi:class 3 adenylate cyclase